jgi:hypothetical protein
VAATPEEFPGDDAFAQLSGQERASHWQQARARIAELNQQVAQAQQAAQVIHDWGGPDQVNASLDLLGGLMQPVTDPQGNVLYGEDGLPETSSSPFWQSLRERSPQLFVNIGQDWLEMEHSPGQKNWQVMFEHVFGLDPAKLDLYQRITQNPQEAAQYLPASDQTIPQWELEGVAPELQEAYRATAPEMREQLQSMSEAARDGYLREKQAFMEERRSREVRDQQAQAQAQAQHAEFERRMATEAANHAMKFRQEQRQSLKDELTRNFSPTGDQAINDRIYNRILDLTEYYVNTDPQLAPLVANADYFMRMEYVAQQRGDQVRAAQARFQANSNTSRALAMVRKYMAEEVRFEDARTTGFREGWDQQREQARGRTVLPRSEAAGLPSGSFAPQRGASPFTQPRYDEIARQIQQQQQIRSNGY